MRTTGRSTGPGLVGLAFLVAACSSSPGAASPPASARALGTVPPDAGQNHTDGPGAELTGNAAE